MVKERTLSTTTNLPLTLPIIEREPAPCERACPAGIDISRYIGYVARGKFPEATAVVRERIPFPSVCGYICYRPCEAECRRGLWETPVAINAIKDAAARRDDELWRKRWEATVARPSGKRAAIVGSGPAGLTAAYYLGKRLGHDVTVFEAEPKAGGQLRIGVPPNRLPRDVLDREIKILSEVRVDIRVNYRIDDLEALMSEGFDAVFLSVGTCSPRSLDIPGEELPGVSKGVSFLKQANLGVETGKLPKLGSRVAIIGAGNVAVDCARTAIRLGASDVRILYRRSRKEMPAYDFEMRAAELEGTRVDFLVRPLRIEGTSDDALRLHMERMRLLEPGADGRAAVEPVPGSDFELSVDNVLVAIGQTPSVPDHWKLEQNADGTISVRSGSLQTMRDGIFAGGDVVSGPQNIIEAIAHGRRAASEIDRYLGGTGDLAEVLAPPPGEEMLYPSIHPFGKPCVAMSELPKDERTSSFDSVLLGYTDEEAQDEALRCVRCDLWSLKGVPRVWWEHRGLRPYWYGGADRRSRVGDEGRVQAYGPYEQRFDHAPFVPEEYSTEESTD
jgi:formate dehydrogenase beta subunit